MIERKKSFHVGATPRWTLSISVWTFSTRKMPSSSRRSCVAKSITASTRFSRFDSRTPTMFTVESSATITMPPMMSPGLSRSGSQNTPR